MGRRKGGERGRLFVGLERLVLGAGMGIAAFFIERRLLKALKAGGLKPKRPSPQQEPEHRQAHVTRS